MSHHARTYLLQARQLIERGENARAIELLRKAKLFSGNDPSLLRPILQELCGIGPSAGAPEEIRSWQAQLRQLAPVGGESSRANQVADFTPKKHRRWLLYAGTGVFAVIAIGVGLYSSKTTPPPAAPTPVVRDDEASLREALNGVKDSVYIIIAKNADGTDDPNLSGATAWAVRPGKLATNGHVTDLVHEIKVKNKRPFARRTGAKPVDLLIVGEQPHPGWTRWKNVFDVVFLSEDHDRVQVSTPFDVGILYVNGDVGEPLIVAKKPALEDVAGGDRIGYVGFPSENITGITANRKIVVEMGNLTNTANIFLHGASYEDEYILQHNIPSTGGASGSPMLNSRGEVIGLINAGNPLVDFSGNRIPTPFNVGQRVDLLTELLDGTAEGNQAKRNDRIIEQLRNKMATSSEYAEFRAKDIARQLEAIRRKAGDIDNRTSLKIAAFEINPSEKRFSKGDSTLKIPIDIDHDDSIVVACTDNYTSVDFSLRCRTASKDLDIDKEALIYHAGAMAWIYLPARRGGSGLIEGQYELSVSLLESFELPRVSCFAFRFRETQIVAP